MPKVINPEELGIYLTKAKRAMLSEHTSNQWPKAPQVAAFLREAFVSFGSSKSEQGPLNEGAIRQRIADWQEHYSKNFDPKPAAELLRRDLVSNANHYRRRAESKIGTDTDRRMAEIFEDEITKRRNQEAA